MIMFIQNPIAIGIFTIRMCFLYKYKPLGKGYHVICSWGNYLAEIIRLLLVPTSGLSLRAREYMQI